MHFDGHTGYQPRQSEAAAAARSRVDPPFALELEDVENDVAQEAQEASPLRAELQDDIANAERYATEHAGRLLYVAALSPPWLHWDGCRWAPDETGEHIELAKETADRLLVEALAAERDGSRGALKHALASRRASRLEAMARLASSDPRIARRAESLDSDPWALNTPSGTLDLRTQTLRPHDPADGITMVTKGAYVEGAQAPTWEAFLERILPDAEVRGFLRRLAGVACLGRVREQVLAILWGSGANGKSTLTHALHHTLGDYAYAAPVELLLGRRASGAATPEIAALRGRRLVTVAETREDGRLPTERVKVLTGGDPITARHLYAAPLTFEPTHTIWLATNHRPRITDDGDAIWRRVVLVPFGVRIPEEEQDPELPARLEAEADGILAWVVRGVAEYLADGLRPPQAVRAATAEYRSSEDAFGAWLAECCVVEEGAWTATARLRESYAAWAARSGAEELTSQAIAERLGARGLPGVEPARASKGTRGWRGIRLSDEVTA